MSNFLSLLQNTEKNCINGQNTCIVYQSDKVRGYVLTVIMMTNDVER